MRYLTAHTRTPTKATLPAMAQASALWLPGVSEGAYPTREEYVADLVRVMRQDLHGLVDMGVRYIQLDSPRYTYACSEDGRNRLRALGIDPDPWLGEMIAFDNELIAGFEGVTFGLHLCRGNHRSMWPRGGRLRRRSPSGCSATCTCERFLLEYDTPRAGSFEPLRFVPRGQDRRARA